MITIPYQILQELNINNTSYPGYGGYGHTYYGSGNHIFNTNKYIDFSEIRRPRGGDFFGEGGSKIMLGIPMHKICFLGFLGEELMTGQELMFATGLAAPTRMCIPEHKH